MATDAAPSEVAAAPGPDRVRPRDDAPPAAPARPQPAPPPAASPPAAAPHRGPAADGGGWGVPLAVLIVGMFMSMLDISIVNVAIPTMQRDFSATTEQIQWVENAYSLALGVVVPVSAWLASRFGPGRVYNLSLLGFAAGSALCGLAWDLNSIVAFRVLQALPGGVLPVVTLTILYRIVPREKIGAAMGMYGLGIVVAPAIGPTLGGYLVEYVDWRLIFFINVPVGIAGTVAAVLFLPQFGPTPVGRFDVLGFLCVATGLVCLLLALTEGQSWGWTSYPIMILLTVGVLLLALFVVIELEVDAPAARRARVPALGVHELAAAGVRAVGRPVRRAVLHPAAAAAGPRARRVRHRPAPAAAGAGDGRADAQRRPSSTTGSARAGSQPSGSRWSRSAPT